jgi:hypothetical protein
MSDSDAVARRRLIAERLTEELVARLAQIAPAGLVVRRTADGIEISRGSFGEVQAVAPIVDQDVGSIDENVETAARSVLSGLQEFVMECDSGIWPTRPGHSDSPASAPSAEAEIREDGQLHLWWAGAGLQPVLELDPIPVSSLGFLRG